MDKRADLAYPLSEKTVLRDENVMDLADLDGRIYKYIDETTVRTLQFASGSDDDRLFIDLADGGRSALRRRAA